MRKQTPFAGVLSILLLMVMLTACGSDVKVPATQTTEPVQTEQQPPQTETTVSVTEDVPYVVVNTPYGDLFYQDQWGADMTVEQLTEGDSLKVNFSTVVNGTTYPLFSFVIGSGEGTMVGELTDAAGIRREVYASMASLPDMSVLTAAEQNRLYAMQEDINYVIQNLK